MDRELACELSLPASGLSEIRYLHLFPSPPPNASADSEIPSRDMMQIFWPSPRSQTSVPDHQTLETGWFFYLAEIALKRILGNLLLRRYGSKSRTGSDRVELSIVAEFERQIQEW
jgi:hypothetical protein